MPDYKQIVDELRSIVLSVDQTLTDRMKELAPLYAQACNEVNQRLGRCEEFLKKGLRSEAIHMAQTEPVLVDQLAILDFPERPQWEELALTYGLQAPPPLKVETAVALNEAYADEQPLEDLLKKHRLLALARGSLLGRLSVMRRIAELDSGNPVWKEDIRDFEKQRFREIQNDLTALSRGGDYEGLAALSEELRTTSWIMPVSQSLIKQVETAKGQFRKSWATSTLKSLEAELNEAINAFDVPKARSLRDKWKSLMKDAGLPEGDPLLARANLAFVWVGQQEGRQAKEHAFQDNLDELEAALNKNDSAAVLEQVYHSALEYGRPIPAALESRYRLHLEDLQRKRTFKQRLIAGVGIVTLVLVAALIGVWVSQSNKQKNVDDAVAKMKEMLNADQISETRTFFDTLQEKDSQTAGHPEVTALKTRLIAAEKGEQDRARRFREALKEAEAEPADLAQSPALEKAKSLAKKVLEWDALQKIVEARQGSARQSKLQAERAFQDRIDDVNKQLQKLEELPVSSRASQTSRDLLAQLQLRVSQMQKDADRHGSALRNNLDGLISRVEAVRLSIERSQLQVDLEKRLTASLRHDKAFEAYSTAMEKYCKEFPKSKRSLDFERVLEEQKLWKGVLAWTEIVLACAEGPCNLKPNEAKTPAQKCRDFLKTYSDFVDAPVVQDCLKCLEAVVQRDASGSEGAAHDMQHLFEDFLIKDLWVLKTKDQRTYYLRTKLSLDDSDSVSFRPILGFDGKEAGRIVQAKNVDKISQAPQSLLAKQIRLLLPLGQSEKIWQDTSVDIAERILAEPEMDPILRLIIFKKVLNYAGKGSYPLWLAVGEQRDYLDKLKLNLDVSWINPDDEAAKEVRSQAKDALQKLPSLKGVLKHASEQKKKLEARISKSERTLIGWLARGEAGWEYRSDFPAPARDFLLEVLVPGEGKAAAWRTIGKLQKGTASFKQETEEDLLEGRLIFAEKIDEPQK
jgi:hypothetical protein